MTTKDRLKKMLVDNGMSESQAEEVLKVAIPKIEAASRHLEFIWDGPAEEYPDHIYNVIWTYLKITTKEWLAKNDPEAWYRPLFD